MWIRDAISDGLVDLEALGRMKFDLFLDGMREKLVVSKSPEADNKIRDVDWMKRNLERQKYLICNHHFQAKMIIELQRQLLIVETEKVVECDKLEKEIINLKKNIGYEKKN